MVLSASRARRWSSTGASSCPTPRRFDQRIHAAPHLKDICVELTVSPEGLSLTFPGGATLDPELPDVIPDPWQLSSQLLGQANAALAPLVPIFNILDVVLALFQAVNAIPDAISHLDPSKIADALPDLAKKAAKLAPLVPQLSVPLMILGQIDTLLAFLGGFSTQLRALTDQQVCFQAAENRATALGNAQLQAVADCSKHHVDAQLQSLSESVAPVNRLIAFLNVFAQLVGLGPLPDLSKPQQRRERLLRPFQRDGRADFNAAGGQALGRSAVGQILGTIGASEITPGEVPWRSDFGSLLYRLRNQKNDSVLQELARVYVVDALKR